MARNHDDDPLVDANDVMWWILLSIPVTLVALLHDRVPWWGAVLAIVVVGVAMRPFHRRYLRRAESRRPSQQGDAGH